MLRVPNHTVDCCCSEFEFFTDDYLENTLDETAKKEFEAHLKSCESCRESLNQTKHLIAVARQLATTPIPKDVSARLHLRLKQEISASRKGGLS